MKCISLGFNPNLGAEFMKRYNGRVISFGRSLSKSLPSAEVKETSSRAPERIDPAVGAAQAVLQRFGPPPISDNEPG